MPATVLELNESGGGDDKSREFSYVVMDATTFDDAMAAVIAEAAGSVGGLVRQTPNIKPVRGKPGWWFATVNYSPVDQAQFDQDEQQFSLDMTGGSATITVAKTHVADYAAGSLVPTNHGGAINVKRSSAGELSVEGVDYPIPSMEFTRTVYVASGDMTEAYILALYLAKGGYNDDAWTITTDDNVTLNFDAGNVTFLGASFNKQGKLGKWPVVQKFRAEPNLVAATIGDIAGINKLGAEYIWFEFSDVKQTDAQRMVVSPIYAHVERLGDPIDFDTLVP